MKLTILSKQGSYSLCKCECGNEKLVKTESVRYTQSCGCLRKQVAREKQRKMTKLNEEQVLAIKAKLAKGISTGIIARQFEMSTSAIKRIKTGEHWGWV